MPDDPQTTSGEDAEFRELLRQLASGQVAKDALLINKTFQRRVPSICYTLTRNAADADDLANHVRFVVCDKFDQFEPNYNLPYGNFFNWVTRIARNKTIDDFRRRSLSYGDTRPEEMYDLRDDSIDLEAEAEQREAVERFWTFASKLEASTQIILQYHLVGYSLREIQEKLAHDGIPYSHVAIGSLLRKVFASFIASENARLDAIIARTDGEETRPR